MGSRFLHIVRDLRRAAGVSQSELAARLGTTQSAVARWESGAVSPRLDTVLRLAHACGFEPHLVWTSCKDVDRDQIAERLRWTPVERLRYLCDMLAFEDRAHRARRVPARG
ncbi:MAG: helix-turn-helix transcriptional regulator [Acidobacteria bacterium]|nr:helix-turn-helix transcriptional regulator [Acidobacteriota bacterium]